jgi:hypothetical protein
VVVSSVSRLSVSSEDPSVISSLGSIFSAIKQF